ncbi:hypothetical protein AB0G04_28075 [Actinoplanes sp. NPDC023801]|uniref:hypothetical protein n=1 Tax=Actinoplanes sp. NPDC023801 TaxID=3154595 RepID=UPI00341017AC
MTDTPENAREDEPDSTSGGDYEYDEAHGGGDAAPDVPAAVEEEAQRHRDLNPR